jgi:anti-sigma B factor antagonist
LEFRFDPRGPSVAVIVLIGRLDLLSAGDVKQRIQKAVADGWTRLVIDLGEVAFIDSSGLGALISGLKAARVVGGDLRISHPGDQPKYILHVSTLDRVLVPYATIDDALVGYR